MANNTSPPCNYSIVVDLRLFRLDEMQLDNLTKEFFGNIDKPLTDEEKLFDQRIKICFEGKENVRLFLNALACFALEGDGEDDVEM